MHEGLIAIALLCGFLLVSRLSVFPLCLALKNQEASEAAPRLSISGDDQHRLISTRDTFPAGCE